MSQRMAVMWILSFTVVERLGLVRYKILPEGFSKRSTRSALLSWGIATRFSLICRTLQRETDGDARDFVWKFNPDLIPCSYAGIRSPEVCFTPETCRNRTHSI